MPLLLLLTLYSFWVIALSVRDPARAFVWLVPLVVVTRSVDTPGIGERIALFDVLLVIWLCLFALRLVVGRATLTVSRETVLVLSLYGLFLGINALSLLDAGATTLGVVTLTIYAFGGVICISTVLASRDLGEVKPLLISLIVTLLCVTILTLLEAADLHWFLPQRKLSRATSTFRNPNQLGAFIYVALPIAASYLLYASRQRRLLNRVAFVGVVGSCLAVVLTASRFVLLIVAAETGILLFVAGIWLQARTWSRLLQVAGATLSIGVLALSFGIGERHYSNFQVRVLGWAGPVLTSADSEEFFGRASLQSSGSEFMVHNYSLPLQTLLTEPWLGIGVGNASSTYRIGGSSLEVHSQYFAVLGETGLLGLLTFLLFLTAVAYYAIVLLRSDKQEWWIALGLAIAVGACLVSGIYVPFLRRRQFWVILGLVLAATSQVPRRRSENPVLFSASGLQE